MSTYPLSLADNEEFKNTLKSIDDKVTQELTNATRTIEVEISINYKTKVE